MLFRLILPRFVYRKVPALVILISFLFNSLSPVFAAWDDYERGREAFENRDYKAAFHAFKNVAHYHQAGDYLKQISNEIKSTPTTCSKSVLTKDELSELESLVKSQEEDLRRYFTKNEDDLAVSLDIRQFLEDCREGKKAEFPKHIIDAFYGSYHHAKWLESLGRVKESIPYYEYALNNGDLSAFTRFRDMPATQKDLFRGVVLYQEILEFLKLGNEDVFDRVYELANMFRKVSQTSRETSQAIQTAPGQGVRYSPFTETLFPAFLRLAARRGNNLKAQLDLLNMTIDPRLLNLPTSQVTTFPKFPEALLDTTRNDHVSIQAPSLLILLHTPSPLQEAPAAAPQSHSPSQTNSPETSISEEDIMRSRISLCAYAAENGSGLAAYQLGKFYENGTIGGQPSLKKAFEWLNRASTLGFTLATIKLGNWHLLGTGGIPINKDLARDYFLIGVKQDHAAAMFSMGILSLSNSRTDEAIDWLEKSVSGRYSAAFTTLMQIYATQPGYINYSRAAQLMREFFSASNFTVTQDTQSIVDRVLTILLANNAFSAEEESEIFKLARLLQLPITLPMMLNKHHIARLQLSKHPKPS